MTICPLKEGIVLISKEQFVTIKELKACGHSQRAIARMTGLNPRTVRRRLKEPVLLPRKGTPKGSLLDPFKEIIARRVHSAWPERIAATVIARELRPRGYTGGLTILRNYIRSILPVVPEEKVVRFETPPGRQMHRRHPFHQLLASLAGCQLQMDWATLKHEGKTYYAFIALMGYSRAAFVKIVLRMDLKRFIECHKAAFGYFGGVPNEVLYDNMKTVVLLRNAYGKGQHRLQDDFRRFAQDAGFKPRLCQVRRPQTKGKVERFVGYYRQSCFVPLKTAFRQSGLKLDLQSLNSGTEHWLESVANVRVHEETKERPVDRMIKERANLQPMPATIAQERDHCDKYSLKSSSMPYEIAVATTPLEPYDRLFGWEWADAATAVSALRLADETPAQGVRS